jgi:hypothetical protein
MPVAAPRVLANRDGSRSIAPTSRDGSPTTVILSAPGVAFASARSASQVIASIRTNVANPIDVVVINGSGFVTVWL